MEVGHTNYLIRKKAINFSAKSSHTYACFKYLNRFLHTKLMSNEIADSTLSAWACVMLNYCPTSSVFYIP